MSMPAACNRPSDRCPSAHSYSLKSFCSLLFFIIDFQPGDHLQAWSDGVLHAPPAHTPVHCLGGTATQSHTASCLARPLLSWSLQKAASALRSLPVPNGCALLLLRLKKAEKLYMFWPVNKADHMQQLGDHPYMFRAAAT